MIIMQNKAAEHHTCTILAKSIAGRPGLNHRAMGHEQRMCSTLVESALQIDPFLKNKPNFRKS
jgi:hypothetical protein